MDTTTTEENGMQDDQIDAMEAAGVIDSQVAQVMRETREMTAEPCPTCAAGRGRWCDHRAANFPRRTIAGLIGNMPHGSI